MKVRSCFTKTTNVILWQFLTRNMVEDSDHYNNLTLNFVHAHKVTMRDSLVEVTFVTLACPWYTQLYKQTPNHCSF